MSQLRHTELSNQAQQLLSACHAHKERIRDLFQSKLEEVRLVSQPSDLSILTTLLGQWYVGIRAEFKPCRLSHSWAWRRWPLRTWCRLRRRSQPTTCSWGNRPNSWRGTWRSSAIRAWCWWVIWKKPSCPASTQQKDAYDSEMRGLFGRSGTKCPFRVCLCVCQLKARCEELKLDWGSLCLETLLKEKAALRRQISEKQRHCLELQVPHMHTLFSQLRANGPLYILVLRLMCADTWCLILGFDSGL